MVIYSPLKGDVHYCALSTLAGLHHVAGFSVLMVARPKVSLKNARK
jgi:hypothetical protein